MYYIFVFIFSDNQLIKFITYTCGWASTRVKFKFKSSFYETLPGVCSTRECYAINFARIYFLLKFCVFFDSISIIISRIGRIPKYNLLGDKCNVKCKWNIYGIDSGQLSIWNRKTLAQYEYHIYIYIYIYIYIVNLFFCCVTCNFSSGKKGKTFVLLLVY